MNPASIMRQLAVKWWFTITLLCIYTATFEAWRVFNQSWTLFSGATSVVLCLLLARRAWKHAYFRNRWDLLFHLAIILDLFLEMLLIQDHSNSGFYLCAVSFAAVAGYYHNQTCQRFSAPIH